MNFTVCRLNSQPAFTFILFLGVCCSEIRVVTCLVTQNLWWWIPGLSE
jgi:hypothetical protein